MFRKIRICKNRRIPYMDTDRDTQTFLPAYPGYAHRLKKSKFFAIFLKIFLAYPSYIHTDTQHVWQPDTRYTVFIKTLLRVVQEPSPRIVTKLRSIEKRTLVCMIQIQNLQSPKRLIITKRPIIKYPHRRNERPF